MRSKDSRQFSVKARVPWWVMKKHLTMLHYIFREKVDSYLGRNFKSSIKCFPYSQMCRFTVTFENKWKEPDAIEALIEKLAKRAIASVVVDTTKKE